MGLFTRKKPIIYETPWTRSNKEALAAGSSVYGNTSDIVTFVDDFAAPQNKIRKQRRKVRSPITQGLIDIGRNALGLAWAGVAIPVFVAKHVGMPAGRFVVRQLAQEHSRRRFLKTSSLLVLAGAGAFLSGKGHISLPNFDGLFSRNNSHVEIKNLEVVHGESAPTATSVAIEGGNSGEVAPVVIKSGPSKIKYVIEEPPAAPVTPAVQEAAPEQAVQPSVTLPPAVLFDENVPAHIEARVQKEVDDWTRWAPKAVHHAVQSGLIEKIKKFGEWTEFPYDVLMSLSLLESTLGANPEAGKDILQVKPDTFFDNLILHGRDLERLLVKHDKNGQALKVLRTVLPFVNRVYHKDTDRFRFVFDDAAYLKKYKKFPVINGKMVSGVEELAIKRARDNSEIATGLTVLRLKQAVEDVRTEFMADFEATKYINGMASGSIYRLAHAFGPAGLMRMIKHRDSNVTDAFPDKDICGYFGILRKGKARPEIQRLVLIFDGVQEAASNALLARGFEKWESPKSKKGVVKKVVAEQKQGKSPAIASAIASGKQARQNLLSKQTKKNTALLAKAR